MHKLLREEIADAITEGFGEGTITGRRVFADRIELDVDGYTTPIKVVGPANAGRPRLAKHDVVLPAEMPRQIAAGISLDVQAIIAGRNGR